MPERSGSPPPPSPGEGLRVLCVYAEALGSRPLATRLEREQLLDLFYDEVMPDHRVEVEDLCHGVTRRTLEDAIREAGGFHVVHWSGHGHQNLLELAGEDSHPDRLTGEALVELFRAAGGFIPRLVFLSACLSGTLAGVRDRASLDAALREGEPGAPPTRKAAEPERVDPLTAELPGYTGTALALLGAGVPHMVAMRYEVGDAYARDLAVRFYRRLLADRTPKAPDSALHLARTELLREKSPEHDAVDHATPLLFGGESLELPLPSGRSPALLRRRPRPQPLLPGSSELDRPADLVGRGEPLCRLHACLESGRPAVALVQGLAGLGKTALVAEAIHLWHRRFDRVFAFESKPLPLALDEFFRRLDERLTLSSAAYRGVCEGDPYARVHLPAGPSLQGEARFRKMEENLLEALRNERLLLVLDNFETQLERVAGKEGYACEDPGWDRLLDHLAQGLPKTGSRLLVTSRHRLAALAEPGKALWLPLGPLPAGEAILFLQGNEALRQLAYGDTEGRAPAWNGRRWPSANGSPILRTGLAQQPCEVPGDPRSVGRSLSTSPGRDRLCACHGAWPALGALPSQPRDSHAPSRGLRRPLRAVPPRRPAGAPRIRTAAADPHGMGGPPGRASGGDRSVCRGGAAFSLAVPVEPGEVS